MKLSTKRGFGFGLTSGIITTLGMIVGLDSGTHSMMIVIGGILMIAIADAFSDALGIHISEEYENRYKCKQIWEATLATFASKFIIAISFIIPFMFFDLNTAVVASIVWGLSLMTIFNFTIAKNEKTKPWKVIGEHLTIAVTVIIITYFVGQWIASVFI